MPIRQLVSKITVDRGNYHTDKPSTVTRDANRMLDDDEANQSCQAL